ncbi:RNA polymerase sigma factor [Sphingobacterium hungaricum]|uniref:RNA polymerase subunit sigma-24 n=1 Tax=Sphingobacterium hungaricum TaxID=2082723 RepID=A0A928V219_9SPHI|nr:sigma-70 family RNA polymerase sigma factor [Sphingobacterium hungaricum]MBE8715209.1 RNA polymerase subunit sigma-24 [Sphingobacterium hungaricum]
MTLQLAIQEDILIERCINKDEHAYAMLYHAHAKQVYYAVNRILTDTAEAEDIVQESFCIAFEQLGDLKNRATFGGWVKRIAINRSISFLRKRKLVFVDEANAESIEDEDPMEEEVLFANKVEDIKKAISALPDGYRTIISLHLFEDMSQDEIAKELGLSPGTVRSQYHRAKKKIVESLKERMYYGT